MWLESRIPDWLTTYWRRNHVDSVARPLPRNAGKLIESFVLREGTDYGEHERTLDRKSPTSNASYSAEKRCWYGGAARNGQYYAAQSVSRITCNVGGRDNNDS